MQETRFVEQVKILADCEGVMKEPNENHPPTVADERAERLAHRDRLAALLKAHPWQEIEPEALKRLIGDNYQQRISNCRTELKMRIVNVPKWLTRTDGSKQKLAGSYRYEPEQPLGRDASIPMRRPVQPELFR